MQKPFRAAIIGVSGYGNTHYNMLVEQIADKTLQPVAATVINQDEEKEKCDFLNSHGAELFDDYRRMLMFGKVRNRAAEFFSYPGRAWNSGIRFGQSDPVGQAGRLRRGNGFAVVRASNAENYNEEGA